MKHLRTAFLAIAANTLLAACEIPTEAPKIDQRWVIPVEATTLEVDELLPTGVTVSGSDFDVDVDPFTTDETLGNLCGGCAALNGQTAPVPAFNGTFSSTQSLPSDVSAATITSGTVQIQILNGFSFDPLSGGGTLTVTVLNGAGGTQLGQVVINGASEALNPGGTTTRTLSLATGAVGGSLAVEAQISAPGGQNALITTSDQLTITATTTSLLVASATVNVTGRSVALDAVTLDVADIDSSLTDRIQEGSVILDIANPFGVSFSGTVTMGPTSKSLSISGNGTSTVSISYTGQELRSFLGQPGMSFSGSGTLSGGSVTVSPGQKMTIDAKIDLTIQIG
jgi:hypothetical protein